jgi:hypothetical protein
MDLGWGGFGVSVHLFISWFVKKKKSLSAFTGTSRFRVEGQVGFTVLIAKIF